MLSDMNSTSLVQCKEGGQSNYRGGLLEEVSHAVHHGPGMTTNQVRKSEPHPVLAGCELGCRLR